ncbi:hypothetical protein AVEN_146121-1 [Araneus ventricosus]|uniref:Uncharacterized protein n=1 Tax=Araneus ventricosus TaxID=182803 RepID=A0A4Y2KNS0_ARAVE|nr:hypothetical protein AVEN_146121-1 [Araneus ventricosus]
MRRGLQLFIISAIFLLVVESDEEPGKYDEVPSSFLEIVEKIKSKMSSSSTGENYPVEETERSENAQVGRYGMSDTEWSVSEINESM